MNERADLSDLRSGLEGAFRAVKDAKGMGGFILGLCAIDWLASFYFAKDVGSEEYKNFVRRFLPKYNAEQIYHDLRCGLVHNFTNRGNGTKYDFREDAP